MKENKSFSRVGLSYTVYMVMVWLLVRSAAELLLLFGGSLAEDTVYKVYYIAVAAVQYGICLLLMFLMLRRRDGFKLPRNNLSMGGFIMAACIICGFMLVGSMFGSFVNGIISELFGVEQPTVAEILSGYNSPIILFMDAAIIAPVAEEFIFRKLIIDRLYPSGKTEAILVSALMFGAAHGNFEQFFYAVGIGIVFAYIYANTGKLRYSVFLHFVINLIGVLQIVLNEELVQRLTFAWGTAVILLGIAGIVCIIGERRKLRFLKSVSLRKIFLNFGMITAVLLSIAMFVCEYI